MSALSPAREAAAVVRGAGEGEAHFRAGVRAMLPLLLAYAPIGLVVGAHVAASSDPFAAWLSTWLIYGGAAQIAVLDVLSQGSGWAAAAVVGLLVQMRLAAYATAMGPEWRSAPTRQRVAAAVMLTDAPWAIALGRERGHRRYYLGAALTLFVAWPVLVSVGVPLGSRIGALPVASLLLPLTLGAVVVPQLRQRPAATAIVAASVCAMLTVQLPAGLALALVGLVGGLAGVVAERLS